MNDVFDTLQPDENLVGEENKKLINNQPEFSEAFIIGWEFGNYSLGGLCPDNNVLLAEFSYRFNVEFPPKNTSPECYIEQLQSAFEIFDDTISHYLEIGFTLNQIYYETISFNKSRLTAERIKPKYLLSLQNHFAELLGKVEIIDEEKRIIVELVRDLIRKDENEVIPELLDRFLNLLVQLDNSGVKTDDSDELIAPDSDNSNPKANEKYALIMKGGGIKGLAYIGAIKELEKYYQFDWYAGTSAGAITAALLAVGYSIDELEILLNKTNFRDFLDARWYSLPFNLFFYKGLYKANSFTAWLDILLAEKLNSPLRVKMEQLLSYSQKRDQAKVEFPSFFGSDQAPQSGSNFQVPSVVGSGCNLL